jgi:hypothetical protein
MRSRDASQQASVVPWTGGGVAGAPTYFTIASKAELMTPPWIGETYTVAG